MVGILFNRCTAVQFAWSAQVGIIKCALFTNIKKQCMSKLRNCLEMHTCAQVSAEIGHTLCTSLDTTCALAWSPHVHYLCSHAVYYITSCNTLKPTLGHHLYTTCAVIAAVQIPLLQLQCPFSSKIIIGSIPLRYFVGAPKIQYNHNYTGMSAFSFF